MDKGNVLKREDFERLKLQNQFSLILANVTIPAVIYQASGEKLQEAKQILRHTFNNAEVLLSKSLDKSQLKTVNEIKANALEQAFNTLEELASEAKVIPMPVKK